MRTIAENAGRSDLIAEHPSGIWTSSYFHIQKGESTMKHMVRGFVCLAFAAAFTALAGGEDAAQYLVVDVSGGAQAEKWAVECRGAEADAAAFNASAFKTDRIVLRRVRAGAYWLGGADERTRSRLSTEKWQGTRFRHQVELSRDYFIGLFPVTQRQYAQVTGRRPSHFRGDELPVESVSFLDVMGPDGFMALLAKKTGLAAFALPSLAQWEVAARAGTDTFYYWGDESDEDKALEYAWFGAAAKDGPRAVGSLKPNAWGIYDILGNVLELIDDSGCEPHAGVWRDPGMEVGASGWRTGGRTCPIRGGAWSQGLRRCVASPVFNGLSLKRASYDVGFRIAKLTGEPRAALGKDQLPEDPVAVARAKEGKVRKDRAPEVPEKFDVPRTMFISHRGESHDAPENTMAAYDMARSRGLSFELDVYLSKDGKLFCFHDPDLKKVSGKSLRCEEASWEEDIKDLDVGVHKGLEWKGLKPCLLEDVFRKHMGEVPMILVHVKGDTNSVPALVRLVKSCPKATPRTLAWTGNDVAVAAALERELPGHMFFLGANTSRSWQPNDLDTPVSEVIARMRGSVAKVVALRWNPDVVTKRYVKALHDAGYKVDVWTPDSPADAAAAIRAGVDYITSNRAKALCDELIAQETGDERRCRRSGSCGCARNDGL